MNKSALVAPAALFVLLSLGTSARAFTVTATLDGAVGSLRQGISATPSGGSIDFNIPTTDGGYDANAGTFTLLLTNGELQIARDLTINGPTNTKIIVSGNNKSRVFNIAAGNVTITNLTVTNGVVAGLNGHDATTQNPATPGAAATAGGIVNSSALTLRNCTISNNTVVGGSGGNGDGTTNFTNGAAGGAVAGGGISSSGTLMLINCTVRGNSISSGAGGVGTGFANVSAGSGGVADGGGIASSGSLTIVASTVTFNSAIGGNGGNGHQLANGGAGGSARGAGISETGASPSLTARSAILAGNVASAGVGGTVTSGSGATPGANGTANGTDVFGSVSSQGHNLVGRTDGNSGWIANDLLGGTTDGTRLDPLLGFFQDNGGPTMTAKPMAGSAAIDNGDDAVIAAPYNAPSDQRGFARNVGAHADIGAVETGITQAGPTFTVTNNSTHDYGSCTTDDCSLAEAVNAANANADANTINFAANVTGVILAKDVSGYPLSTAITISGPGARILSISGPGRLFLIGAAGNATISNLTLANGFPGRGQDGGGIYNAGQLTLKNCSVRANQVAQDFNTGATGNGGAILNVSGASLTLDRCTFSNNIAGVSGGAIYSDGNITATNCTFTANTAQSGGGIVSKFNNGAAIMTLRNCTLTNNTATAGSSMTAGSGGGGIYAEGGAQQHFIGNTIVAANSSGNDPDLRGQYTSQGHNLVGKVGDSVGLTNAVNGDIVGDNTTGISAQFSSFANNGGLTDTWSLLNSSPAINAGDNNLAPLTDQRGYLRAGVSDIGAFEFNGAMPSPLNLTSAGSRKTHGMAGTFDVNLPLAGGGVESRTGGANGAHTVVFTFANNLTAVGMPVVTSGTGYVSNGQIGADAHQYVLDLTGVANAQTLSISLTNVNDSAGNNTSVQPLAFRLLVADTNGDGVVNSGDATIIRNRSGQVADATNFRSDLNLDGSINSADATIARNRSGQGVPLAEPGPITFERHFREAADVPKVERFWSEN